MAREWFRRRPRQQIEGFWRVSVVSRVALRREEVSFFMGSSGRSERKDGRERPCFMLQMSSIINDSIKVFKLADDRVSSRFCTSVIVMR